ncbi:dnaJ homolog subfamily C member 24 isoform X2 [Leuresthes tenuis]|uniref:dnaJ homolog subfamily C member 24 isoform X2 n=1 Tax=Leuresthes tenuis TaxID=355514 RepID=UPI003B503D45
MCDAEEQDLYAVLGASPSDSVQQLRHRYQQLALQYHPDRLLQSSSEAAGSRFVEVEAAWRILRDQNTRRQYDLQRREECVYTYCCRCGGGFSISEEETRKSQQDDEEEEAGQHRGVLVCCDTCSLTVYVTWSLNGKT